MLVTIATLALQRIGHLCDDPDLYKGNTSWVSWVKDADDYYRQEQKGRARMKRVDALVI